MTWMEGETLAQTLYTCLYVHHLQALEEYSKQTDNVYVKALHAYIFGAVACARIVFEEMRKGNLYEVISR